MQHCERGPSYRCSCFEEHLDTQICIPPSQTHHIGPLIKGGRVVTLNAFQQHSIYTHISSTLPPTVVVWFPSDDWGENNHRKMQFSSTASGHTCSHPSFSCHFPADKRGEMTTVRFILTAQHQNTHYCIIPPKINTSVSAGIKTPCTSLMAPAHMCQSTPSKLLRCSHLHLNGVLGF